MLMPKFLDFDLRLESTGLFKVYPRSDGHGLTRGKVKAAGQSRDRLPPRLPGSDEIVELFFPSFLLTVGSARVYFK